MSAEAAKVYALSEVSVNFLGVDLGSGYGDGGGVTIEPDADAFGVTKGADGSVVRYATGNNLYKVTLSLLQTSAVNQALSAIHNVDRLSANGAGVGPLLVRNRQGLDLFVADKAWIASFPTQPFQQEATNREWVIMADAVTVNVGGA